MSVPPMSHQERKTAGPNHFLSSQPDVEPYVKAVRAVVQAAVKADPAAEADYFKVGRRMCQDAIVQRYKGASPTERRRVDDRLKQWQLQLEAHDLTQHSFRWVFGTTEQERLEKRRIYVDSTRRTPGGEQALGPQSSSAAALAGTFHHGEIQSRAQDGSAAAHTLFYASSTAQSSNGHGHEHDNRRSSRSASTSPEPSESESDSESEYPPVPRPYQGYSSPYFVPPPARRDQQQHDGESPYRALGRRAGASVRVLERRRGGAASGAW